jgi:hypothetical protein
MNGSGYETLAHLRELESWTCAWYDEAVKAGTIGATYFPDTPTTDHLRWILQGRPVAHRRRSSVFRQ